MSKVVFKNIRKDYDQSIKAVKDFNLEIEDKQFCVLVGPSGCGKSTTLRMVAGLEETTNGEIFIDDVLVNDLSSKERNIAMVFQNYALYPHMTVFENMSFGLKIGGYPKTEIEKRVKESSEMLGLNNLLTRIPASLSGGQRQRVALGRAIVHKPKVFLFDEPLSNLDAQMRTQMRGELSKLHTRLQSTIIYVTHDQVEAMALGDMIVVMKDGLIQQVSNPIDLYHNPSNKFVASFIGTPPMNFFECEIKRLGRGVYLSDGGMDIKLLGAIPSKFAENEYSKDRIILGIRPEDIYPLNIYKGEIDGNTCKATVEIVENLGATSQVYMDNGKNNFIYLGNSAFSENLTGMQIEIAFDMHRARFFDVDTEEALFGFDIK